MHNIDPYAWKQHKPPNSVVANTTQFHVYQLWVIVIAWARVPHIGYWCRPGGAHCKNGRVVLTKINLATSYLI